MTALRQRMLEDMRIRNLSTETRASYIHHVARFARYFRQSPERLGPEEIRAYQLHLINDRHLAPTSVAVAALRFLYQITLKRDWPVDAIAAPKRADTLPVVLSPEEVVQFLSCVADFKHRVILTICYAAGLRLSETLHLQIGDIDSRRMVLRVARGKGNCDRYVMLSPTLLSQLRAWWRTARPTTWLFPRRVRKPG
jgi:integrase/recombinase XerD